VPPAGYTQLPHNALYVRNSDGSGPYYLSAAGVITVFAVHSPPGGDPLATIATEGGVEITTENGTLIGTEAAT
jgi:hypothetical protein